MGEGAAEGQFLTTARDRQREMVEEYYRGLVQPDGAKKPVAYMLVGGNLTEIVRSFGYEVVFPEIVALNCAISTSHSRTSFMPSPRGTDSTSVAM